MLLGHWWISDNVFPEFRSDISSVDTAAFGDIAMGASNLFCYGGISRNHCGFEPHAQAVRTLTDRYHAAGFTMLPYPEGVRHRRTMEHTTGTIISIAISEFEGVYSAESHLPFPNTPVVRGIGIKWPHAQLEGKLNLNQNAVILGGRFHFLESG